MVAIVTQTPFLALNSMSVEHFGARGTQTYFLTVHYGCNSGPNPCFPFFGHPVVFKNILIKVIGL